MTSQLSTGRETWKQVDPVDVTWSNRPIGPPEMAIGLWATCPCPHCGHTLSQGADHVLGDTAVLRCPSCGGLSVMPSHPLQAASREALHAYRRARERGARGKVLEAARDAYDAAERSWNELLHDPSSEAAAGACV